MPYVYCTTQIAGILQCLVRESLKKSVWGFSYGIVLLSRVMSDPETFRLMMACKSLLGQKTPCCLSLLNKPYGAVPVHTLEAEPSAGNIVDQGAHVAWPTPGPCADRPSSSLRLAVAIPDVARRTDSQSSISLLVLVRQGCLSLLLLFSQCCNLVVKHSNLHIDLQLPLLEHLRILLIREMLDKA